MDNVCKFCKQAQRRHRLNLVLVNPLMALWLAVLDSALVSGLLAARLAAGRQAREEGQDEGTSRAGSLRKANQQTDVAIDQLNRPEAGQTH